MGRIAYDVCKPSSASQPWLTFKQMDLSPELPFSKAFDYASSVTANRFTNPLWRVKDLLLGFKFKSCLREVKSFGADIVTAAMKRRSLNRKPSNSSAPLHTVLVDSLLDHISSPDTVADAAVNFLSAGRDTTAQSLTWTFYFLMRHSKWKDSLLESIQEIFPTCPRGSPLPLSYEMLSEQHAFAHVQAVFAEVLRLNPAVPFELKETTEATSLPDGTELPAGAAVVWIPYGMARSPNIWGEDAAIFNPGRWLDRQQDGSFRVVGKTAFENPVFNAGPRMCIGKRMAEVLALRVLVQLLWEWEIEEVRGPGEIAGRRVMAESLTAPMQGGLPVKIRLIKPQMVA